MNPLRIQVRFGERSSGFMSEWGRRVKEQVARGASPPWRRNSESYEILFARQAVCVLRCG